MANKHEIRKAIYHSSGCDADDWLDGARRNTHGFEGARKALRQAAADVLPIASIVKKDLDDGKLSGLEPSEIADYAILQIMRAKDSLENASKHYENRQLASQGEMAAYERIVTHFQNLHSREEAKEESIESAIASGEIIVEENGEMVDQGGKRRITGVRPSAGLAAQRRAESNSEKGAQETTESEDSEHEAVSESKDLGEPEKPKRKYKKRKPSKDKESVESGDGENT